MSGGKNILKGTSVDLLAAFVAAPIVGAEGSTAAQIGCRCWSCGELIDCSWLQVSFVAAPIVVVFKLHWWSIYILRSQFCTECVDRRERLGSRETRLV